MRNQKTYPAPLALHRLPFGQPVQDRPSFPAGHFHPADRCPPVLLNLAMVGRLDPAKTVEVLFLSRTVSEEKKMESLPVLGVRAIQADQAGLSCQRLLSRRLPDDRLNKSTKKSYIIKYLKLK